MDDPTRLVDALDPEPLRRHMLDKPKVDWELHEIGQALAAARKLALEADHAVRALEEEQARRCEQLRKARRITFVDDGDSYYVKHPAPRPLGIQNKALHVFAVALQRNDPEFLEQAFQICQQSHADVTTWRSEQGESVAVAYARKRRELG